MHGRGRVHGPIVIAMIGTDNTKGNQCKLWYVQNIKQEWLDRKRDGIMGEYHKLKVKPKVQQTTLTIVRR